MRRFILIFPLIVLPLILSISEVAAGDTSYYNLRAKPVKLTKYSGNPVIPEAPIGQWNHWKSDPFVMKEDGVYRMWYATNQEGSKTQIGYAKSDDGIDWDIYPSAVVLLGEDGEWDDEDVETPTVVKHDGVYHLWYSGRGEPEGTNPLKYPDAAIRIGHATSEDGIKWVKDPQNPVIEVGKALSWDWLAAAEPTVIVKNGVFEMWYTGATLQPRFYPKLRLKFFLQIGRATSVDGSNWEKTAANPVLKLRYKNGITTPTVIYNEPYYEVWFVLYDEKTYLPGGPVLYATSLDGIKWRWFWGTILRKGQVPAWDSWAIFGPTVLLDGDQYKMWYSGVNLDSEAVHLAIGYASGPP
jgi:predicted GH43/DUF377 family glycosyl hydrolase